MVAIETDTTMHGVMVDVPGCLAHFGQDNNKHYIACFSGLGATKARLPSDILIAY